MPFHSARLALLALILLALILIVSPLVATASDGPVAIEIPTDADILITDGRGVIVGVGEADEGDTFRLALVEGFSGAATLIFVLDDGSFQEIEVTIGEGGVSIGGRRLGDLVAGAFAHVAIGSEASGSRPLGEAFGPDETVDQGPVAVPPVASPPAVGSPGGAAPHGDAPGDGAAPTPPVEVGPPDDHGRREPAATEPPSGELPVVAPSTDESSTEEPPVDVPSVGLPSADEGPSETPDDAPHRRRR